MIAALLSALALQASTGLPNSIPGQADIQCVVTAMRLATASETHRVSSTVMMFYFIGKARTQINDVELRDAVSRENSALAGEEARRAGERCSSEMSQVSAIFSGLSSDARAGRLSVSPE